nr:substrate-binding domain-containing protein [Micromonospora sp. DSM 115978]
DRVVSAVPIEPAALAAMRTSGTRVLALDAQAGIAIGGFDLSGGVSAGIEIQVGHLHELGHRRLVYAAVSEPRLSSLVSARHQAAVAHARALGLPEPPLVRLDYRDRSAVDAVQRWHAEGVTGVVAYNDDVAALVVGAAVRVGLRLPDDLAVVGHDDVPLASMFVPRLSSVRLDTEALGRWFAEAVLHYLDKRPLPDWIPAQPLLVRRETT